MKKIPVTIIASLMAILFLMPVTLLQAQSKTNAGKVKSITEVVIETKGGKEAETKKSFQSFDERGNLLEEIEYDDYGKIKNHTTSEYNEQNLKVKETSFLPDGKTETVSIFAYDHEGNRISKTVMDKNGEVKSKKLYKYEYR
ncbi:MAG TPA: hypothetical protein PLD84_06735 [Chitinophagales bacterium]|nr:hypothetical protein [Chitinophagales bacterium]